MLDIWKPSEKRKRSSNNNEKEKFQKEISPYVYTNFAVYWNCGIITSLRRTADEQNPSTFNINKIKNNPQKQSKSIPILTGKYMDMATLVYIFTTTYIPCYDIVSTC